MSATALFSRFANSVPAICHAETTSDARLATQIKNDNGGKHNIPSSYGDEGVRGYGIVMFASKPTIPYSSWNLYCCAVLQTMEYRFFFYLIFNGLYMCVISRFYSSDKYMLSTCMRFSNTFILQKYFV